MDFKATLTQRRAINFFDPQRSVASELVRGIIESAALTPSSFNLQPWNVMIIDDPDQKARLRQAAWDQAKVTEAPVVLIVLADRHGWQGGHPTVERVFNESVAAGAMQSGQKDWFLNATQGLYGSSSERQQAFANKNAGMFAMALMLSAKAAGLETHPMDGFDLDAVRKTFNIPDQYWIPMLIAVGYMDAAKELAPPKWRKGFEDIVVRF